MVDSPLSIHIFAMPTILLINTLLAVKGTKFPSKIVPYVQAEGRSTGVFN